MLITGVTGFIGSALSRSLTETGHEVIGLTREPERARTALPTVSELHAWDPDREPAQDLFARADAVINLAGESVVGRWTAAKKRRIYASRIEGTRNLVSAMRKAGQPGTLVSTSAVGYYGDRGGEELTEDSRIGEGFLADVTRDWEREALAASSGGIRVAVMRLGIVLGTEGGALKTMLPLFRLGLGGPLGDGKQWWPWVHIDDVTAMFTAAMEGRLQGIFNVASPQPAPQKDFASALGDALGRPALLPVPGFALRAVQGEFADEVLFSKRVLPRHLLLKGFRFQHSDVRSALAHLLAKEEEREDVLVNA